MRHFPVILLALAPVLSFADSAGRSSTPVPVDTAPADPGPPMVCCEVTEVPSTIVTPVTPTVPEDESRLPNEGRKTRQSFPLGGINRIRFELPAGIRIKTVVDRTAPKIVIEYQETPYTNARGLRDPALALKRAGDALVISPAYSGYMPSRITIYAPATVAVEVR